MRKYLLTALLMMAGANVWAQQKSVTVEQPGTLGSLLGAGHMQLRSLKVSGELNGTDVRLIREMAGANTAGTATGGQLAELDLSEASIVRGGDCYMRVREGYDAYTEANVVSSKMFYGCGALRRVVIPNTARRVYNDSFSACPRLEAIETADNHTFVSIDGVLYRADTTLIYRCPQGQKSEVLVVRAGVKQLYPSAFRGVSTLVELSFPATLQGINDMAFWGCPNIRTIRMAAPNPPAMENAFEPSVLQQATLVVPLGSADRYASKDGWRDFVHIVEE